MPDSEKSIKPVSIGGVAGGQKFITDGILLKFVADAKLSGTQYL